MAINYVKGEMLATNLLRDGVNFAVETDLLYFDVSTGRIGIKTAAPASVLDVSGLLTATTATIGNITLDTNTIQSLSGALTIEANNLVGAKIQYAAPDGYDTASMTYDTKSTATTSDTESALYFSPDGIYIFYIKRALAVTSVYRKTLGTAWDLSTAGSEVSQVVDDVTDTVAGLWLSADGLTLWIFTGSNVRQWTFGVAWDVTSLPATHAASATGIWNGGSAIDVTVSRDGVNIYKVPIADEVEWAVVGVVGDVSSIAFASTQSLTGYAPGSASVNTDGTKMFVLSADDVHEFELSVADDPTSLIFVNTVNLPNLTLSDSAFWDTLGTKYYIWDVATQLITQYSSNASGGGTNFVGYHDSVLRVKTTTNGVKVVGQLELSKYTTAALPTGVEGAMVYDADIDALKFYNGTAWEKVSSTLSTGTSVASEYVLVATTTDATITEALRGGTDRLVLPNYGSWRFEVDIVARRTDADNESAGYKFTGVIDRQADNTTTAIVGAVAEVINAEDNAAWVVTVDADNTNGSLRVQVTGEAAKTVKWVILVKTIEVTN
jgi:hypothetical protein